MAKMLCLQPFRYAGKLLKPGDLFEATESNHVKLLSLIHKAKLAGEEKLEEKSDPPVPKRRYKRRDMQAEDG